MSYQGFGNPISSLYSIPGGQAHMYERGLVIDGIGGEVALTFAFPMIGRPSIVTGDPAVSPSSEFKAFSFSPGNWQVEQLTDLVQKAIDGRFALIPTGLSEGQVPLILGSAAAPDELLPSYSFSFKAPGLQERQLYDIAVLTDDGTWRVIAPHAVYHRRTWTDFGIVHLTDIHVARRIDSFRQTLKQAGETEAAERMYNWNDRFRGFIKFANYMHSIGLLDLILAIGDLYDYIYENDDDRNGGGNAEFFRQLLLGRAPGPDFPDVEELVVPIFVTAGNHDYRKFPYKLIFDLNDAQLGNFDLKRVRQYSGYHIDGHEAAILTIGNEFTGFVEDVLLGTSISESARMVDVDRQMKAYRAYLADLLSYEIRLGKHRIVMLDSGPDTGMVTSITAYLLDLLKINKFSEDEESFLDSGPNSEGISDKDLNLVAATLEDATADEGLVIVGVHAPLFNILGDIYPYFLRETQRPALNDLVHPFLVNFLPLAGDRADVEARLPMWFPKQSAAVRDNRRPKFVKRGDNQDFFDSNVSRGKAYELTLLLAGVGTRRPADVILSGHVHSHKEFRVKHDASGELTYYMDFYTENPEGYYPTRFPQSWDQDIGLNLAKVTTDVTYVEIVPGAAPDATPWQGPENRKYKYHLQIPPYPNPLLSAADAKSWWDQHRPLFLQTGALGPLDNSQFTFSGFRVLIVKNNVIDKVHFIPTHKLEQNNYRMDWDDAIRPALPRRHLYIERSRPLGAPDAAGSPSGIVLAHRGATNVVYRDGNGYIHELWQRGTDGGTSNLTSISGTTRPVPAASDPTSYLDTTSGTVVALFRATNGEVNSYHWSTGEVGHDALSRTAGAPKAAGKPLGYVGKDGSNHVIYRDGNSHLQELWWTGGSAPGHGDLTEAASAPNAVGDPSPYIDTSNGQNIVAYRGTDAHIYTLYWLTGSVSFDSLSKVAGGPLAAGDPFAYYVPRYNSHHVIYRGQDKHIHELFWEGPAPVKYRNLTVTAGAPEAVADPVGFYSDGTNSMHMIYRSTDNHLRDISWTPGSQSLGHADITLDARAPLAAGKPTAFTIESENTHHVVYRGTDNRIHEIRWT